MDLQKETDVSAIKKIINLPYVQDCSALGAINILIEYLNEFRSLKFLQVECDEWKRAVFKIGTKERGFIQIICAAKREFSIEEFHLIPDFKDGFHRFKLDQEQEKKEILAIIKYWIIECESVHD